MVHVDIPISLAHIHTHGGYIICDLKSRSPCCTLCNIRYSTSYIDGISAAVNEVQSELQFVEFLLVFLSPIVKLGKLHHKLSHKLCGRHV